MYVSTYSKHTASNRLSTQQSILLEDLFIQHASVCSYQSWESYFIKVIYYILLFTFVNSNALQLHTYYFNLKVILHIKLPPYQKT